MGWGGGRGGRRKNESEVGSVSSSLRASNKHRTFVRRRISIG